MKTYKEFLQDKAQLNINSGFKPLWMPDFLFDFQKYLFDWSLLKGRSAIFADCGLGKTPIQLVWAENVVRKTNKPVLIITPYGCGVRSLRGCNVKQKSHRGRIKRIILQTSYQESI